MKVNKNFNHLVPNYLFADISKKVNDYASKNPHKKLIRLGIGDVTLPLCNEAVKALKSGSEDLSKKETFKGYPDYEGYEFVRQAVSGYYNTFDVEIGIDEIFISDGAKSDTGNIGDIFSPDNTVLVADPVYPVYVDTNIMAGRKIIYIDSNKQNNFSSFPDKNIKADMIYLCSPNNPTGSVCTHSELKAWVDYAIENDAVILYDAAYEAFISDDSPRSIFAVDGARQCAIEFCSLSKTAGFTGTRCGYTVVPKELTRDGENIYKLWYRRQATKFNGVSWPVQCAAAAVLSPEGQKQFKENINYYKENVNIISRMLDDIGVYYTGGINSPYLWLECPNGMGSWDFFDYLLEKANVVGTPGEGFGNNGKGFFRLTGFGNREDTIEAVNRIKKLVSAQ